MKNADARWRLHGRLQERERQRQLVRHRLGDRRLNRPLRARGQAAVGDGGAPESGRGSVVTGRRSGCAVSGDFIVRR